MKLKNLIRKNWQKLILVFYTFLIPVISFASSSSGEPCDISGKLCNPLGATKSLPVLIQQILEGALKVGIPLIALAVIYCGFLFVKAQGNPEEITKAKDALLYTLIGSGILLGAWAIAKMISATVAGLAS